MGVMMNDYEYLVTTVKFHTNDEFESQLDSIGSDGWELVSIMPIEETLGFTIVRLIFKSTVKVNNE